MFDFSIVTNWFHNLLSVTCGLGDFWTILIECIYGMGGPTAMNESIIRIKCGQKLNRNDFLRMLVSALYIRNDVALERGNFSVKGDTVNIAMAYSDNVLKVCWWDDEIDSIEEVDAVTMKRIAKFESYQIYPANLFVTTKEQTERGIRMIQEINNK